MTNPIVVVIRFLHVQTVTPAVCGSDVALDPHMPLSPFRGTDSWSIHAALDTARDGILIECAEQVVYANTSYAQLLGYRGPAELVRRSIGELIAECDSERLVQFGRSRVSGKRVPSSYDFAALRSDGSSVRLQASVSVSISGGRSYIMTIARPFSTPVDAPTDGPIAGMHDSLSPRYQYAIRHRLVDWS